MSVVQIAIDPGVLSLRDAGYVRTGPLELET